MTLKLYEIESEYIALANSIIDNDGEVTEEQEIALQINKEQLENKGRGYGFVVKTIEGEIDLIDLEIKRLQGFKKSREKAVDRLKESLSNAMQLFEIEKLESPTLKISFRKSESVEIENINLLDEKFIVRKVTESADKLAIKEALKKGEAVVGATLSQNKNIQIK